MAGLLGVGGALFGGISSMSAGNSAAKTPMGIGPMFSRISGQMALAEAKDQANLQIDQSLLEYQEGLEQYYVRKREIESFKESQGAALAHGGLTLSGSALAITEETQQLGNQELASIMRATEARSKFLERDALRILRGGYAQKFSSDVEAMMSEFSYQNRQRQLRSEATRAGISGLFSAGKAVASYGSSFFK